MRLSDARVRRRKTKLIYPNHRLPPWLTEDAPRDRSNRLLGRATTVRVVGNPRPKEALASHQAAPAATHHEFLDSGAAQVSPCFPGRNPGRNVHSTAPE